MGKKIGCALTSLLLASALAAPSGLAVASAKTIPSVAGRTTIQGGKGVLTISVPSRATVSAALQNNPDIQIDGGEFTGFSLIPLSSDNPAVFAGEVSEKTFCTDGCPQDGVPTFVRGGVVLKGGSVAVEPGIYSLYLIGEGPISVRLRLHGLSGRTTLRPAQSTKMRVATLEPDAAMPGQNVFSWYGGNYDLGGAGEVFSVLWWKTQAHVDTETDYCLYSDEDRTTEPHALGCPFADADYHYSQGITSVQPAWNLVDWVVWGVSGNVAQGWTYGSAGIVDSVGGVALWLPY